MMILTHAGRILVSALGLTATFCFSTALAQVQQTKGDFEDKFRQLDEVLPTANNYRTASGAPGHDYWQQQVDYHIDAVLDEDSRRLSASETITYTNNSPDTLRYLWVQLDQNRFIESSLGRSTGTTNGEDVLSYATLRRNQAEETITPGFDISQVTDSRNNPLAYSINDTMMRIDLPNPLRSGQNVSFTIDWEHNILESDVFGGRGGAEHFPDTDTWQFAMAQWYPRMASYTDYAGWQNKQFIGRGEFTLEFGNYEVNLTVPADHIVSATGVLQNPAQVLSAEQRSRLEEAENADKPVFIVTPEEALANEQEGTDQTVTWRFEAENVRDFAWVSSRKYIWDAMGHHQDNDDMPLVMAMSFYPNEGEPLWSQYSTEAVVHTMDVYSRFSFDYPYPMAISVNAWEAGGMEYPMITFNGYRPVKDEETGELTYPRDTKYGLIGVIIHEIGHTYFPMIVNSDERQWTWMDEGINSFLEYLAEVEWGEDFSEYLGDVDRITPYMVSENQVPIMTNSESILQFGPNAYAKPEKALVILRETVMGRELFDYAFREYSQRWMFKRPTPSDLFRTMEDASAVDLDWFWRGWFYSTDHVDIALTDVREYKVSTQNPDIEKPLERERAREEHPQAISFTRNNDQLITRDARIEGLDDFYSENDDYEVSNKDRNDYNDFLEGLEDWESTVLEQALEDDDYIYFIDFENIGGLVMPIPLRLTFLDGSSEDMQIPAEIWRRSPGAVTRMIITESPLASVEVDPLHGIADADRSNNHFPRQISRSRIELFKQDDDRRNQMADMLAELKTKEEEPGDDSNDVPLEPVSE